MNRFENKDGDQKSIYRIEYTDELEAGTLSLQSNSLAEREFDKFHSHPNCRSCWQPEEICSAQNKITFQI